MHWVCAYLSLRSSSPSISTALSPGKMSFAIARASRGRSFYFAVLSGFRIPTSARHRPQTTGGTFGGAIMMVRQLSGTRHDHIAHTLSLRRAWRLRLLAQWHAQRHDGLVLYRASLRPMV